MLRIFPGPTNQLLGVFRPGNLNEENFMSTGTETELEPTTLEEGSPVGQDPVGFASTRQAQTNPSSAKASTPNVVLPDDADLSSSAIGSLRKRLQTAVAQHDGWADPIMFNGGTIVVLVLTGLATLLPSVLPKEAFPWAAPLCAALAGLLVAMERALGFGARWRYHREMRSSYESIVDMLEFYPILPLSERPKYARDIFVSLYAVRSRESAIPNAGTNSQPT